MGDPKHLGFRATLVRQTNAHERHLIGRCDSIIRTVRTDTCNTTITETRPPPRLASAGELVLVWVFPQPSAPAVDLRQGRWSELTIGRGETCAIRLTGSQVSREHAALRRGDPSGPPCIVDLESRNGVRVNGRLVPSAPLRLGDVVSLGGWVGVVTRAPGCFGELAPGLLGGATMSATLEPLERGAASDLPVVLEGETGTGKERVARAVHLWSGRGGPFLAVNCASLPDGLAEAELFGHRRGAFTGADRASQGLFRSAQGGTLLLDEVSDLSLNVQAKLLRVLEEREVHPLGETRPVSIDVRVVVAGQQSLSDAVNEGRFRADLLARLDGLTVRLPPLRRRREDILPLFSHYLREKSEGRAPAVEADLVERLCVHDWPFNVREVVLLAQRLVVLHAREVALAARHLPQRMNDAIDARLSLPPTPAGPASPVARPVPIADAQCVSPSSANPDDELAELEVALRTTGGNVSRASAMLRISRQRAYRLMEGADIDLDALRREGEDGGEDE